MGCAHMLPHRWAQPTLQSRMVVFGQSLRLMTGDEPPLLVDRPALMPKERGPRLRSLPRSHPRSTTLGVRSNRSHPPQEVMRHEPLIAVIGAEQFGTGHEEVR